MITTDSAGERQQSSLKDDRLSQVIGAVDDPSSIHGIILYGSWARDSNDAASDVDLLVIHRAGPTVEQTSLIADMQVDLYIGTLSDLRQRLNKDYPLNNNFILNALHEGVVCLDRGGWAGALMSEAELRWEKGPTAITTEETNTTRWALRRMLSAAKRLSSRASLSKQAALIAEMRSNQVVIQSVYLYHCVRRQWTTSFPLMLRRLESEKSVLYELWDRYVNADSQEQRIHVSSLFVKSVYE